MQVNSISIHKHKPYVLDIWTDCFFAYQRNMLQLVGSSYYLKHTGKHSNLILILTGVKFIMLVPIIAGAQFERNHLSIWLSIEIPCSFLANGGPIFTTY